MALDRTAVGSIAAYAGWQARLAEEQPEAYATAALVLELPNKKGGWGMTPVGGTCVPGFYACYVCFLRWAATTTPSLMAASSVQFRFNTDRAASTHPPIVDMLALHASFVEL
eukprot:3665510-Rhodomonas_salina.3